MALRLRTARRGCTIPHLIALGMDPVAEFVPPEESRHTEQAKEFPLELLARKADNFLELDAS